ncbi:[FeFe] hydrogenase H-cluster maturation GTPase HydF [Desulfoluna sp.]|uniref:[FeFe] hydrogenase H-cluster maturation GTPase HydF n=1 Tax=Desulfoluna sp. TaxID=2045199 RepID=UPI0026375428|nr:[FeFe] hydrogenase H-cluster maturation GTPase HydF [Desulfoluna sp.]
MSVKAPKGVRLVITLTGRRNAGKSSLINAICGEEIAIVSEIPGTTTDPVARHHELLPLGPATFYDTAGLDDEGPLGELRIQAARKVLFRTDVAVVVAGEEGITAYEKEIIEELRRLDISFLVALNKKDLRKDVEADLYWCNDQGIQALSVSAQGGDGVRELKEALIAMAPEEFRQEPLLVRDLVNEGDWVVCVVPIDLAAPKGRLILPQVMVLRDILDADAVGLVVKERELEATLANMGKKPALVITDSQAVLEVAADVPDEIPMTTFSTLMARYKGDLKILVDGADMLDNLKDGDTILMGEACSHHQVDDDIGRVKIPHWITQYTGLNVNFEFYAGHDFPENLEKYALAIHCGGCMLNRTAMLRRIRECQRRGVPITNYGVAISKVQGLLNRVIKPFGMGT